jgi:hypothetical protein
LHLYAINQQILHTPFSAYIKKKYLLFNNWQSRLCFFHVFYDSSMNRLVSLLCQSKSLRNAVMVKTSRKRASRYFFDFHALYSQAFGNRLNHSINCLISLQILFVNQNTWTGKKFQLRCSFKNSLSLDRRILTADYAHHGQIEEC